jgi:hypothetical protein
MEGLTTLEAALLQAADLFKLEKAPSQSQTELNKWFVHNQFLYGVEKYTYSKDGKCLRPDLVTLYDYKGLGDPAPRWMGILFQAILSKFSRNGAKVCSLPSLPAYTSDSNERQLDPETGSNIVIINRGCINFTGTIIAALFSFAIPLLAIITLYYVKGTPERLGVAAGFTLLFAIALVTFTTAKKSEIFAAVAG